MYFVTSKTVCEAYVCMMAKLTKIVLDRQNFKCLSNNACSFGRGFTWPDRTLGSDTLPIPTLIFSVVMYLICISPSHILVILISFV